VVAGGRRAPTALQHRSGRPVGEWRAGEVGQVRLLPGIFELAAVGGQLVHGVVQPGVPFGRHLGGLGLALVHHPATLATVAAAAAPERTRRLLAVIAVAELVGADELALPLREKPRAERHFSACPIFRREPSCPYKWARLWHP